MNAYRARPLSYPWPPLIFALAVVAAFVLSSVRPLPQLPLSIGRSLGFGIMLVLVALAIDLWALITLHLGRTTILPHRKSTHLITSGPFRFSRNPIYLSYTLMTAGIGFLSGNVWFLIAAPLAALVTYLIAIRAEELHLLARFGIEFERYCRRTRCWL